MHQTLGRTRFHLIAWVMLAISSGLCRPLPAVADLGTSTATVALGGNVVMVTVSSSETQGLTASTVIDGAVGGSLQCGRWTVIVPPRAYLGSATIMMAIPNPRVMQCSLDISPARCNAFLVPVRLVADCKDGSAASQDLTLSVFNPLTGLWSPVPGSTTDANLNVSAPLQHFSTYCVGHPAPAESKAGW